MKKELHDFYCLNCGSKIPLMRSIGHQYKKHHRKKLYCYHCKTEVNHVECRSYEEAQEFKEAFVKGVYYNEAQESMAIVRNSGFR